MSRNSTLQLFSSRVVWMSHPVRAVRQFSPKDVLQGVRTDCCWQAACSAASMEPAAPASALYGRCVRVRDVGDGGAWTSPAQPMSFSRGTMGKQQGAATLTKHLQADRTRPTQRRHGRPGWNTKAVEAHGMATASCTLESCMQTTQPTMAAAQARAPQQQWSSIRGGKVRGGCVELG
eukprot:365811-Chlamydomonas_euryale.AAC.7